MKREKEYNNMVKHLTVKPTPKGLYKEERIWAEGKDM